MKITLPGAVFLVLLIMKLSGHIAWSWWWVTAPIWGTAAIGLSVAAVIAIVGGVMLAVGHTAEAIGRWRKK